MNKIFLLSLSTLMLIIGCAGSKPKPVTKLGIRRLSIEKRWQKLNKRTVIVRPGGIYSNSSNILTKFLEGDHKIIFKKNHFTNRIHIPFFVNGQYTN